MKRMTRRKKVANALPMPLPSLAAGVGFSRRWGAPAFAARRSPSSSSRSSKLPGSRALPRALVAFSRRLSLRVRAWLLLSLFGERRDTGGFGETGGGVGGTGGRGGVGCVGGVGGREVCGCGGCAAAGCCGAAAGSVGAGGCVGRVNCMGVRASECSSWVKASTR